MQAEYQSWEKKDFINEIKRLKQKKRYGLVWDDKEEDVYKICKEKIPVIEEITELEIFKNDSDPDLIIEGDNFHSLLVLNSTHKGKIDGIYIDPPYNTGKKDWKYNNKFIDEEDPYRHSKWISFMNKRLLLAKELLKKDGVICVTIDDYEMPRILLLMEEIFGESNRLGVVCIRNNPSGRSTLKGISINHEYAIFFGKSSKSKVGRMPRSEKQFSRYKNSDNKGMYEEVNFRKGGGIRKESPKSFYPFFVKNDTWRIPNIKWNDKIKEWELLEKPDSSETIIYPLDDQGREKRWKWGLDRVKENPEELFVRLVKGKKHIFHKNRMAHTTVLPNTWWDKNEYSAQDHGTKRLKEIFGELKSFDYPKAVSAVEDCLRVLSDKKDAIFLDFFAGSGTTGEAVKNLNAIDNGSRKFILCTNNENNIARDDCYERIKRLINGYDNQQTNSKVEGVESNLKFFKTKLIKFSNSDNDRKHLFDNSIPIIQIRESAYKLVKKTKDFKIFTSQGLQIAILSEILFSLSFKLMSLAPNSSIRTIKATIP